MRPLPRHAEALGFPHFIPLIVDKNSNHKQRSLLLIFFILLLSLMSSLPQVNPEELSKLMSIQLSLSDYGKLTINYPKPSEIKQLPVISTGFLARLCCQYDYGIGFIRKHLSAQSRFFRESRITPSTTRPNHFLIKPRNLIALNEINQGRPWVIRGYLIVMQEVDFPFQGEVPSLMSEPMWCSLSGLPSSIQNRHDLDIIFSCMGFILQIQPRNFSKVTNSTLRIQFMYDVRTPLLATLNSVFSDGGKPINFSYLKFPKAICHKCRIVEHPINPCLPIHDPNISVPMEVNFVGHGPSENWALTVVPPNTAPPHTVPPHEIFKQKGKRKDLEKLIDVKIEIDEHHQFMSKKLKEQSLGIGPSVPGYLHGWSSSQSSGSSSFTGYGPSSWYTPPPESIDSQEERRRHIFADQLLEPPRQFRANRSDGDNE